SALDIRIGPGSAPPTGPPTGCGAGPLSRRSRPTDLGSYRPSEQKQEAASHPHLRRGATNAAPRSGAVASAAKLRYGFLALSDPAPGRRAAPAAYAVASDA